jgi:ATP-binding cassette subfamily F protein uup
VEAKASAPAAPKAPARPAGPAAQAPRRRLSFNQQHALEALPRRIEALGAEIATLRAALAAPDLYARDRARFDRFTAALTAKEAELAAAEEEWLELELLREEIEGG